MSPKAPKAEIAERTNVGSAAPWEKIVGYSRLVRIGPMIWVTGTTAFLPDGGHAGEPGDKDAGYTQALQALVNIERALAEVGATLENVVRTRMFLTNLSRDRDAVGRAHGERFSEIRPATSMLGIAALYEPWMLVEIEADAYIA